MPWQTVRYHAWEAIEDVYLFGYCLKGEPNHDGPIVALDFEEEKATWHNGYLDTPYIANEAGCRHLFGKLISEGAPDPGDARHQYTTDMLGRAITCSYPPGLTSMHLYSTPELDHLHRHAAGGPRMVGLRRADQDPRRALFPLLDRGGM